jgi:hypothetical protein
MTFIETLDAAQELLDLGYPLDRVIEIIENNVESDETAIKEIKFRTGQAYI